MSGALPPGSPSVDGDAAPLGSGYDVLYRFTGSPSGSAPAGLIAVNSTLYGTTIGGGAKTFGTVFVRDSSGTRILYNFQGGTDGAQPEGSLVELNGTLYGTTEYGGAAGDGTVFAVSTTTGRERVVYSFEGGSDGATPVLAGLLVFNGELYGTTNAGGDPRCHYQDIVGCGTVFEVGTSGGERVLHRFTGKPDGACPSGSLIESGGILYGTTNFGGRFNNGSVFSLTSAGVERRIYSFKGYPDGVTPMAGLTFLNGRFYGTTTLGGAFDGSGTVFVVDASGSERVLHSFKGAPDGALPYAGLTAVNGLLFGTTEVGGNSGPSCIGRGLVGCGTIFAVRTSGSLTVLYRFRGRSDGASPWSTLVTGENELYGTTLEGGTHGNGTLFEIAPTK